MSRILIVISITFWASCFVGIRAVINEYNPIDLAVFRFIVSSFVLLIAGIVGKIRIPTGRDFMVFVILGFVLFANAVSLNYGTRTLTAGEATFIVSTSQIFQVLLACIFLNETVSRKFIFGLILSFTGVAVISLENSTGFSLNQGVIYILIAAITTAVFFILQKHLLKRNRPIEVISYSIWTATILMLPFGKNLIQVIPSAAINSTLTIIYVGISAVIANLCWSFVLSKIQASKAATFLYTIPVMTIVIGFLWLNELPSLLSCLGGVIIIGGVVLSNLKSRETEQAVMTEPHVVLSVG